MLKVVNLSNCIYTRYQGEDKLTFLMLDNSINSELFFLDVQ